MGNMSYCRFENTSGDLGDCLDSIDEKVSKAEHEARIDLVKMCAEIVFDFAGATTIDEAVEWAESLDCEEGDDEDD